MNQFAPPDTTICDYKAVAVGLAFRQVYQARRADQGLIRHHLNRGKTQACLAVSNSLMIAFGKSEPTFQFPLHLLAGAPVTPFCECAYFAGSPLRGLHKGNDDRQHPAILAEVQTEKNVPPTM